jgi:hypothetical protein
MATVAFKLNKAQFTNSGEFNYEAVGTLAEVCKGMKLRFTKTNLASERRVTILADDKAGDSYPIPCSLGLSKSIRSAIKTTSTTKILASLVNLSIQQDKDNEEKYFLMAPMGEALEGVAIKDLVKEALEYEDLLALA